MSQAAFPPTPDAELHEQIERLERTLGDAPFPAALWSATALSFLWLNSMCRELVEGPPDSWDVLGMPFRGFLSEAGCATRAIDVAYTGQPSSDHAYVSGEPGAERVWNVSYLPVSGRVGDPSNVLITGVEVTECARIERAEQVERELLYQAASRVSATVLSSLDAEEILERVLTDATEALGADWSWLAERRHGAWVFRSVHGWPVDAAGHAFTDDDVSLPGLAARRGSVVRASLCDCSSEERALMERQGIGAFALVPVQNRGHISAVLGFCWTDAHVFSDAAGALLRSLGASLPLALENARQFEEQGRFSQALRSALLPDPASIPGFEIGHLYHAVSSRAPAGGGFYDVLPLTGGRFGVLMGDVKGSGAELAVLTASMRSTMRSAAHRLPAPGSVLARANDFACSVTDRGVPATAFMGLVGADGRMEYALAGHPAPVVLRTDGSVELLNGSSNGLGTRLGAGFAVRETTLDHGDLVVLYTEGVTSIRNHRGARFGIEGLTGAVGACAGMPARDVPEALFMSAFSFGDGRVDEELAILALRRAAA